ncbi:MAG: hypothetical protein AB1831_02065 [Pseudomonadota bacterium]
MARHVCPACGKSHEVPGAHQSVAWGRQLCCSCDCELERRARVRRQLLEAVARRTHAAHGDVPSPSSSGAPAITPEVHA